MMIKEFTAILCLARLATSVPYQYNSLPSISSTASFLSNLNKQNLGNSAGKFNVGYKVQDGNTAKVKKEFSNSEYQNLFDPDSIKRPYSSSEFDSFDDDVDFSTTAAAPLSHFPYANQLKFSLSPNGYSAKQQQKQASFLPVTASNKIFVPHGHGHGHGHGHHHHHHHDKHHFVHDIVGHYISDVAGHKLKHVGEVLESGELNEPIIHKLFFAKAALLPLLAIIGSLSAINGIHIAAKASDPHAYESEGVGPASLLGEHSEFGHKHHPHTLVGLILHFVSQLSKFNNEAKLHVVPNLLRIVSRTSSTSAHASGHHPQ